MHVDCAAYGPPLDTPLEGSGMFDVESPFKSTLWLPCRFHQQQSRAVPEKKAAWHRGAGPLGSLPLSVEALLPICKAFSSPTASLTGIGFYENTTDSGAMTGSGQTGTPAKRGDENEKNTLQSASDVLHDFKPGKWLWLQTNHLSKYIFLEKYINSDVQLCFSPPPERNF